MQVINSTIANHPPTIAMWRGFLADEYGRRLREWALTLPMDAAAVDYEGAIDQVVKSLKQKDVFFGDAEAVLFNLGKVAESVLFIDAPCIFEAVGSLLETQVSTIGAYCYITEEETSLRERIIPKKSLWWPWSSTAFLYSSHYGRRNCSSHRAIGANRRL